MPIRARPLTDSAGTWNYAAMDFGTATTLVVCGGIPNGVGLGDSSGRRGIRSEAPQMIPFTLAMLRLIERIRLAERRMTVPPLE
ncbi:hypothetical protein [Acidicapsa ligni]|uniref:hypothetical protein n=1 Tax=Acidicapsa ligni TaxID=542300 RepID=UPI0021E08543|nr:hypothetical protein [Acidicapsa ligni]